MKTLFRLLLIFWAGACLDAQAQVDMLLDKNIFRARVSMIDEFMSRFNMEEFAPTVNQSEPDARRMNLYSLVDFDYATSSDSVSNRVIGFADAVLNHDIKLQFEDTAWCAIAKCVGKLNKKEVSFNLKLTTEHRGQGMYKWVIKDAEGIIFDLEPTVDLHTAMISPENHEINFMALRRITEPANRKQIAAFAAHDCQVNPLAVFLALVYHGYLAIDGVDELQFVFGQVPGYRFEVKYFNRQSSNSGWLIHRITRLNDSQ